MRSSAGPSARILDPQSHRQHPAPLLVADNAAEEHFQQAHWQQTFCPQDRFYVLERMERTDGRMESVHLIGTVLYQRTDYGGPPYTYKVQWDVVRDEKQAQYRRFSPLSHNIRGNTMHSLE